MLSLALILPLALTTQTTQAQTGYTIQTVNHNVQILYTGQAIIQDNIQLTGQTPSTIQIGFPYKYANYLLKGTAYDNSNNQTLPIALGVPLQDKSGFYGTTLTLTQTTQNFTVVFIFSNGLLTNEPTGYILDFPAYPSFTTTANQINASLTLPTDTTSVTITKPDGTANSTRYSITNLAAFTYAPATARFQSPSGTIQPVNIPTLTRQINVDVAGAIISTDTYKLINNDLTSVTNFAVNLPTTALNINAKDGFGRALATTVEQRNPFTQLVNVTLITTMEQGESTQLTIDYTLPRATLQQSGKFTLDLDLLPYFNYYVEKASVTITPPEGAKITAPVLSATNPTLTLIRNVFQDSVTISQNGVTFIDSAFSTQESIQVSYDYSPLWVAFRPTSWIWAIALIGCAIAALWTRPRTKTRARIVAPKMAVGLGPEHLKSFIDSYEERNRITSEIRSLEARAQRGRMPRRRYKVQRKMLEGRLNTLTQNLNGLKDLLRGAGGSYGDFVRQLEIAEVELSEVELSLQTMETRHAVGELPLEDYRRQLVELERRKQKAEAAVSGLLLRLRQEIR
jgi:hypothetical protein